MWDCSSSLFICWCYKVESSSCVGWCIICYCCVEYCLLLCILSWSSVVSSFIVSIAHLKWKIFFSLQFSPVDITYGWFGHNIWTLLKSDLSLLFFSISVHLCIKSRESAFSSMFDMGRNMLVGNTKRFISLWSGKYVVGSLTRLLLTLFLIL